MLDVGVQAPRFNVMSTRGSLALEDLLADGPVVLYFFPRAFTSG